LNSNWKSISFNCSANITSSYLAVKFLLWI